MRANTLVSLHCKSKNQDISYAPNIMKDGDSQKYGKFKKFLEKDGYQDQRGSVVIDKSEDKENRYLPKHKLKKFKITLNECYARNRNFGNMSMLNLAKKGIKTSYNT